MGCSSNINSSIVYKQDIQKENLNHDKIKKKGIIIEENLNNYKNKTT